MILLTCVIKDDDKFLNFLHYITNKQNAKHLKRYKQRISACSMASNKMVWLAHVRRWKKRKRSNL